MKHISPKKDSKTKAESVPTKKRSSPDVTIEPLAKRTKSVEGKYLTYKDF